MAIPIILILLAIGVIYIAFVTGSSKV